MSARFGSLDERGRAVCPRCGGISTLDLGDRLYRCEGRCRDPYKVMDRPLGAGEREFRIRADDAQAWARSLVKMHDTIARDRARYEAWMDRYGTRPRTQSLRVLRPSREVSAAWRAVRAAKRVDSFTRRAQTFVNVLDRHVHDVDRTSGRFPLRLRYARSERNRLIEDRSWTRRGTPNVIVGRCSSLGLYKSGLGTHSITIRNLGSKRLDEMRATLIHEVQHWLDNVVEIDDEAHGRRWGKRLAGLLQIFPPSGLRSAARRV